MKKIILFDCEHVNDSDMSGDWVLDINKVNIYRSEDSIYFTSHDIGTLRLTYIDEVMAKSAMHALANVMCEPIDSSTATAGGYIMPIWDRDTDELAVPSD